MEYEFDDIESVEQIGKFKDEYVYDIEMESDSHTFMANKMLVHNSLFVSFKPAMDACEWKNLIFNEKYLNSINKKFVILNKEQLTFSNENCISYVDTITELKKIISENEYDLLLFGGSFIKDYELNKMIKEGVFKSEIIWNWANELDFIHAMDKHRYAGYFTKNLEAYADKFGVENREDFELERISESVINIAKKKYIQHIVYEDGINYDRLSYLYPKGVELVRRSTPAFAREKIVEVIKYLFSHPDSFNVQDLLKLIKSLKKEFDMMVPDRIDEISMQSSVSNYETKVLDDKNSLKFVSGAHFAVKAASYHNYLLHKNPILQEKYDFIRSGNKIKYYYTKSNLNGIFAFNRGSFPIEFAPDIDLEQQFYKSMLSPINSIVKPLNIPPITERLSIVVDIFNNMFD